MRYLLLLLISIPTLVSANVDDTRQKFINAVLGGDESNLKFVLASKDTDRCPGEFSFELTNSKNSSDTLSWDTVKINTSVKPQSLLASVYFNLSQVNTNQLASESAPRHHDYDIYLNDPMLVIEKRGFIYNDESMTLHMNNKVLRLIWNGPYIWDEVTCLYIKDRRIVRN